MKTFRIGGVHPAENKLSAACPIKKAALPKQAVFSLYQHIGAPAKPVVAKGDEVKVGTMLADADGFVSAPVFSSVSGKVAKIDAIVDASGYRRPAIFVDVEGDVWEDSIDRSETLVTLKDRPELTAQDIVAKVKAAGVVGMGGATFPCHVKLSPPPGSKAECVVINGVECEPYLTADHRLMLEKPDEILVGVALIMKAVQVSKAYIGIENNKPDAIKLMTEKAAAYPGIEIVPLQVKYPQGGEKQLVQAITGREVPAPPAIPIQVGAVVQNVGTAYAIYEAVMKNKPLLERVITVTGKSVKQPTNFLARIGTPMSQSKQVFDLSRKDGYGNTTGKADYNRIGDEFDNRSQTEYAKQNENDTCHNCGNEQSAFAILLDNAINNNNKGTSRTANLYPASSENRDGQTGNNSSDNSFLRSDSRSDAECNGQWQSYDTNNDTGHNV